MDELLQKLVESDLLTEDTKNQLTESINKKLAEKEEALREEIETDVKATLAEKYAADKEELVEALDTKITAALQSEVEELREDIEAFRDLEAEYARKLVESKKAIAASVKDDMGKLIEGLDAYVEQRLHVEVEELRESIEEVRKENYGRKILESIGQEYRELFVNDDDLEQKLAEGRDNLERVNNELLEATNKLNELEREQKMDEVLESLSGRTKDVMEAVLQSVPTDKLDEAYNRYIGRILKESASNEDSEKEDKVLAEGKEEAKTEKLDLKETKVVEGNKSPVVEEEAIDENVHSNKLTEAALNRLKVLSGNGW